MSLGKAWKVDDGECVWVFHADSKRGAIRAYREENGFQPGDENPRP